MLVPFGVGAARAVAGIGIDEFAVKKYQTLARSGAQCWTFAIVLQVFCRREKVRNWNDTNNKPLRST
jgi:hypothetical protein